VDIGSQVQKELVQLKDVTVDNLNKILERDVKINVVLSKTAMMSSASKTYKNHSKNYNRQQCCRRIMYTIATIIIILIIAYVIAAFICGFSLNNCSHSKNLKEFFY